MGTGSDGKITKPDVEAILGEAVSSGDGSDGPQSIMISVPVAPVPPGVYLSSHVEVQRLTQGQRTALRIMCEGLDRARGCLANGKRVRTNADVVRWLLERAATILASSDNGSGA